MDNEIPILGGQKVKGCAMNSTEKQIRSRLSTEWDKNTYHHNLKLAQKAFNKMIRMEAANDWGYCTCVCSGEQHYWKGGTIDAGHFVSATRSNTRFDEMNVHPQASVYNEHSTSNDAPIWYALWMAETYGMEAVKDLMQRSRKPKKWSKEEIIDLRVGWSKRIKEQEKRLGDG